MSAEQGMFVPTNRITFTESGAKVTAVEQKSEYQPIISLNWKDTAVHEAGHAVAAIKGGTGVSYMSIVPGPGYLGITQLTRFDAAAAIAPHAHGADGTGHDTNIVSLTGNSINVAAHAARERLKGAAHEILEAANEVKRHGTISGAQISAAMERGRLKKEEGETKVVDLVIKKGHQEVRQRVKVKRNVPLVMIPGEWLKLGENTSEDLPIQIDEVAQRRRQREETAQAEISQKQADAVVLARVRRDLAAMSQEDQKLVA